MALRLVAELPRSLINDERMCLRHSYYVSVYLELNQISMLHKFEIGMQSLNVEVG